MVNVTHDNDNRASRLQIFFLVLALIKQLFFDGNVYFLLNLCAHFLCNDCRRVKVDGLRNICHNAQLEQLFDDVCCGALQAGSQLADIDFIRNHNLELNLLELLLTLQALHLLLLLLTALVGERSACIRLAGDFLLARLHAVSLLRNQRVNAVVVTIQIDIACAAGIDAVNLLALRLLVLLGRNGRRCRLAGALRTQNLALLMRLCLTMVLLLVVVELLFLCSGSVLLRLLAFLLLSFRLCVALLLRTAGIAAILLLGSAHRLLTNNLCRRRLSLSSLLIQDFLHVIHRMLLGHIIKNQIQFIVLQNLHVILRRGEIFCHHIGDVLGIYAKILSDFMYTVFIFNTHARSPPRFV